ncbi:H(+)/Cl(-) exchange transporter ClcA [Neisseriaceae bacterium TC5R-5]|nr:H(+)/Cl(-) exchange transporter ClcA [Neisseriaceae bacterium TC5R-5]
MKQHSVSTTPYTLSTRLVPHLPYSRAIRQLLRRDKTPLATLMLAALLGVIVGLLAVAFEKAVNWILQQRLSLLLPVQHGSWTVWLLAFGSSALLAASGYYLVRRYAPEAGGSGIPEIEGALIDLRPVRWWRVLPVKFIGGLGTLGAGMVLGREGPTVQMGGNAGRMVFDLFRLRDREASHSLLATGAAAGLAAAFNAPLAGILFVIEEMRSQFRYNLISIKAVFIGVIMSNIVYRLFNGDHPVIAVGKLISAPTQTLWLYLLLGILFGAVGVMFNALIFRVQDGFARLHQHRMNRVLLLGALLGGVCGVITLLEPELIGGGFSLIPAAALGHYSISTLLFIFAARLVMTLLCFCSGAPGGIFAPMLALGTLFGTAFGLVCVDLFPAYGLEVDLGKTPTFESLVASKNT